MSRYKLFIGHLSPDVRTKDLERFFKDHGFSKTIQEVVVKTGYGFVVSRKLICSVATLKYEIFLTCSFFSQVFDDRRDADDAIYELNGKELLGTRCLGSNIG